MRQAGATSSSESGDGVGSTRAALAFAAATLVLVALAVFAFVTASQRPAGQGFVASHSSEPAACGDAVDAAHARVVAEPFVPFGRAAAGCERYQAFEVVTRPRRSAFELVSVGRAELRVDGRLVIRTGTVRAARPARAEIALEPGVHAVDVTYAHADADAYLRLHEDDVSGPHFKYGVPPLERERYFADAAHARAALLRGVPTPPPARALLAGLCCAGAALCAWFALRLRSRRALPRADIALALSVSSLALWLRARGIAAQDEAWDELAYTLAGRHFVRNLQLSDFSQEAFRYNYYHPPLAKWLYGAGHLLGGHDGARMLSALLGAAAVAFGYGTARVLFDRAVALVAASICAFLPSLVAHARLTGLETPLLFFWSASLLGSACWLASVTTATATHGPARPATASAF